MEFTTFRVFTKQESPFEGFLRQKREVPFLQSTEEDHAANVETLMVRKL